MKEMKLYITGMSCAACVNRIEKVVKKLDGVDEIRVNLATEQARLVYHENRISLHDIKRRIESLGFGVEEEKKFENMSELKLYKYRFLCSALLTLPLIWVMLSHLSRIEVTIPTILLNPWIQLLLTAPIQWVIGWPYYKGAWKAVKSRSANMDVLVVLSTSTAFFYSLYKTITFEAPHSALYYETSAMIITFILLGKWMEEKSKEKARTTIRRLYEFSGKRTVVIRNGKSIEIDVKEIVLHDLLLIKPGAKIPTDGEVIEGKSTVDESLLTGESIPVDKGTGDLVFGGTTNQHGVLKMKVTKVGHDTLLSRIVQLVEQAQASKAPIQRFADQVTEVFVPIIITIALITFFAWYFFLQPNYLEGALEKAISVLIVACPCALGLATPTSIMVGSWRSAQLGVLIKEGKYLELLEKADVILLDKTGTITKGKPELTYLKVLGDMKVHPFLRLVGAAEESSEHPLAQAVIREVQRRQISFPTASHFKALPGYGVEAIVSSHQVLIGTPRLLQERSISYEGVKRDILELEGKGNSVMLVAVNGRLCGILAVSDIIKSDTRQTIQSLKKMGKKVMMITGDNQRTARSIATKLGIDQYFAEVVPHEKVYIIQQLQASGRKVAMIGDGMNDAPALATADIGMAMGTGTDIALHASDIHLLRGNMLSVVQAFRMSKKTMSNIKQNLFWAFGYNVITIPLAMLGLLAPWIAAAVMACSSVSVVANALRLQKVK